MKITPKDYVQAKDDLAKAGFKAVRELLDADKTITEVASTFGLEDAVVELVKTTSSYAEYATIVRLETEREGLEQELKDVKTEEAKVKPKRWHYIVAGLILLGLATLAVWGIILLINWLGGLF
jgi:hypothetical protein